MERQFKLNNFIEDLGLDDYLDVIEKPMDLKTVRKNLNRKKYKRYEEFFQDLLLIWDNCKKYNKPDSDIYELADYLDKETKKLIRKFKDEVKMSIRRTNNRQQQQNSCDIEMEDEELPFEKKVQFTDTVKGLSNQKLTALVKKIKELCPNAIDDFDEQRLHIRIDDISKENFSIINDYINSQLITTSTQQTTQQQTTQQE